MAKYRRKDFLAALPSGMGAAAALLDAILRCVFGSFSVVRNTYYIPFPAD